MVRKRPAWSETCVMAACCARGELAACSRQAAALLHPTWTWLDTAKSKRRARVESAATARYDWLQYNGNAQHSGNKHAGDDHRSLQRRDADEEVSGDLAPP